MNTITPKKLAVLDLDGTLIKGQSQKYLISYFYSKKIISFGYYFRIMSWFILYKLGLTNNLKNVLEFALNFVKDKNPQEIQILLDSFYEEVGKNLFYTNTKSFINQLKNDGFDLLLISSSIDIVAKEFSSHLDIEHTIATQLEIKDEKYTSHILGDIIYGENKREKLMKYCFDNNYNLADCYVYADHYSDLALMESVEHPYFVNPNNKAKALALEKKIDIMYLQ